MRHAALCKAGLEPGLASSVGARTCSMQAAFMALQLCCSCALDGDPIRCTVAYAMPIRRLMPSIYRPPPLPLHAAPTPRHTHMAHSSAAAFLHACTTLLWWWIASLSAHGSENATVAIIGWMMCTTK